MGSATAQTSIQPLSTALVFLASYESGTRLIVSTLLLQVPRGLVQAHQLLVPVFLFLPTPDLETLLQSATADKRRKEGTSLRESVVSLQLCGEVQYLVVEKIGKVEDKVLEIGEVLGCNTVGQCNEVSLTEWRLFVINLSVL